MYTIRTQCGKHICDISNRVGISTLNLDTGDSINIGGTLFTIVNKVGHVQVNPVNKESSYIKKVELVVAQEDSWDE